MVAPETLAAGLIGAGALAAAVRLLLYRRGWWAGLLAALSLVSGALLYATLFPPLLPVGGETLVVATGETPADVRVRPGERLVALPEAPALAGAERVPDLATALRRHGAVQRLRIIGRGLSPRDLDGSTGLPVEFTPLPQVRGLTRLDPPADTPAGASFALAAEVSGMNGGSAELLDPAGRRVDQRSIGADGRFTLGGVARTPGLATFTLRLRGRDKAVVSDTPVPLRTIEDLPIRALLIGAPSPEAKYLRRWAEDSGIALRSRLDAGAGVDLAGDGARLDTASLRAADVVIIDDNALAGIGGGGRAALAQAAAGGLGVVVRMTGPATPAARDQWRALGIGVTGGSDIVPVTLPPLAPDAETLAARRGPGIGEVPADLNTLDDPAPEVGRWTVQTGGEVVAAVTDADGAVLAAWQQRREGRVALWTVPNSFALVLSGQADRYEQWWSTAISAVARPDTQFRPEVPALVQAGERMAICGLTGSARAVAPDGTETALAIDPAAGPRGCAAYWPAAPGRHTLVQQGRDGEQTFAMLVLPQDALTAIRARETAEATARWAAAQSGAESADLPTRRGPAWPWLLAWLAVTTGLWAGERRLRMPIPG